MIACRKLITSSSAFHPRCSGNWWVLQFKNSNQFHVMADNLEAYIACTFHVIDFRLMQIKPPAFNLRVLRSNKLGSSTDFGSSVHICPLTLEAYSIVGNTSHNIFLLGYRYSFCLSRVRDSSKMLKVARSSANSGVCFYKIIVLFFCFVRRNSSDRTTRQQKPAKSPSQTEFSHFFRTRSTNPCLDVSFLEYWRGCTCRLYANRRLTPISLRELYTPSASYWMVRPPPSADRYMPITWSLHTNWAYS